MILLPYYRDKSDVAGEMRVVGVDAKKLTSPKLF